MGKRDPLAMIAGIVFVVGGLVLIVVAAVGTLFVVVHGIIALIIGIAILVTLRKQDFVEPIKKELNRKKGRE